MSFEKKKMYIQEIMLSEISHSQKDKHYVISLLSVSKTVKLLVAENGRVFSRGWEFLNVYKVSGIPDKQALEICCTP